MCSATPPAGRLLCSAHWQALPPSTRRLLSATHVPGDTQPGTLFVALALAVAFLALMQRVWTAEEAAAHVTRTVGRLVERGLLTRADLVMLAEHDPSFGAFASQMSDAGIVTR